MLAVAAVGGVNLREGGVVEDVVHSFFTTDEECVREGHFACQSMLA
jgi:hypothetical protein